LITPPLFDIVTYSIAKGKIVKDSEEVQYVMTNLDEKSVEMTKSVAVLLVSSQMYQTDKI
jgi:hypothetical protein